MLFRFKSKVTGDLLMLDPHGRKLLQVMGKSVQAQGIIQVADMPACMAAIDRAIAQEAQELAQRKGDLFDGNTPVPNVSTTPPNDPEGQPQAVLFKHRALPMLDMLRQCHHAQVPIVWGV